jgi:hypothetical protein
VSDRQSPTFYRDVAPYADGVRLGGAVIRAAIEAGDREWFSSEDFIYYLGLMSIPETDCRVIALREMMVKRTTKPKHISKERLIDRIRRLHDEHD